MFLRLRSHCIPRKVVVGRYLKFADQLIEYETSGVEIV